MNPAMEAGSARQAAGAPRRRRPRIEQSATAGAASPARVRFGCFMADWAVAGSVAQRECPSLPCGISVAQRVAGLVCSPRQSRDAAVGSTAVVTSRPSSTSTMPSPTARDRLGSEGGRTVPSSAGAWPRAAPSGWPSRAGSPASRSATRQRALCSRTVAGDAAAGSPSPWQSGPTSTRSGGATIHESSTSARTFKNPRFELAACRTSVLRSNARRRSSTRRVTVPGRPAGCRH